MALSLDDLTTPMTATEIRTWMYAVFTSLGADTTSWKPGGVTRTLITAVSVPLAGMSSFVSYIAKAGFLDRAEGAWLRIKAKYDYLGDETDALIPETTYAQGEATFTNTGGGIYSWDVGDEVAANSTTGKTFVTLDAFTLSGPSTATVTVKAVESGSGSNCYIGALDTVLPTAVGVTVTNAAIITASDPPSDAQIREICRSKASSLSPNGPRDAYRYFAVAATLAGESVGVTRATTEPGYSYLTVRVATSSGGVTGDQNDPATPLGAVRRNLMLNCVPTGVDINVVSATTATINVDYTAYVYSDCSLTDAEILANAGENLNQLCSDSPIGGYTVPGLAGGYLFGDAIADQIRNVSDDIVRVSRAGGHVDVAVSAGAVPVMGTISGVVVRQERVT